MINNVYVRDNKSIFSISITRILCLIPLIIYGLYKNGIYLYQHHYINLTALFKPLILIIGSILIGFIINFIYEKLIKRSKDDFISMIFSSFHIEYALVLACLMPVSIKYIIYFPVVAVLLFISKFLNNRINIMCLCFLIIYGITYYMYDFNYLNIYEASKTFSLSFMDYLIGKSSGGLASTHVILIILAIFILYLTNNNKTSITLSSIISSAILFGIYSLISNTNFCENFLLNNYIFIFTFVATDSVTSSYTINGMMLYGILIGILTFGFYFINPIISPMIAILIISLFNNLIDRKLNDFSSKK